MTEELQAAKALAVRAGAILLDHYSRRNVRWKGRGKPATDADRSAGAYLLKELKRIFPQDGIMSETESDDSGRLSMSRVWVVQPLDSAVDFINRLDEFAVMIGLVVDGVASVGVVYQPVTEKLYYGTLGGGAFVIENRNMRLLHVSRESNPSAMTIALNRSHRASDVDIIQRQLGIANAIFCGSIGLKVGLICEGKAHLYLHTNRHTFPWDACSPDVILREARGSMTDLLNAPLRINGVQAQCLKGLIATNGTIHNRIVEAAQSVLAQTPRPRRRATLASGARNRR